jgi:acyl-CoA reductase-like NAD-dependent aldehyde dehydrogenase
LTATLDGGYQSIARRIPVGVIGIITPWNSPLILGARAIGPALAMGNAVILKPDVQTPVAGGVSFARLLEEACLPSGLFHVLPGGPETGAALVKEPLIDMISFTGSTRVGRQVGSIASGQLKRVSLELGGNNPYIVLDDADVEAAASAGAWGAFFHQGQNCLTGGRHLVDQRVVDAYVEALVRKAKALVVGNPLDEKVQIGVRAKNVGIDGRHAERDFLRGGSRGRHRRIRRWRCLFRAALRPSRLHRQHRGRPRRDESGEREPCPGDAGTWRQIARDHRTWIFTFPRRKVHRLREVE